MSERTVNWTGDDGEPGTWRDALLLALVLVVVVGMLVWLAYGGQW